MAKANSPVRFSYSTPEQPLIQQLVIRTIEKLTGQRRLERLYKYHCDEENTGEDFFSAAVRLLRLDVQYDLAALERLPRSGPVLFVANHPYGVLDGILLNWLAAKVRADVKVLAHSVLCQAPETRGFLLPIDFSDTAEARRVTLRSRIEAQLWLKKGHTIGIFPGGGVSFSHSPLRGPAIDMVWAPFTAKLARVARATVVPIYFLGQNSRLFQITSHVSMTLRTSLLFYETARKIGAKVKVQIGRPIIFDELPRGTSREEMVNLFRRETYSLAKSCRYHERLTELFMQPTVLTPYKRRARTSRSIRRVQHTEATASRML